LVKYVKAIEIKDGLILEVLVRPRSKAFRLVVEEDQIAVLCREEPAKGKVNEEIMRELSRLFRKRVEIISGFSSTRKRLLIRDVRKDDIECVLEGLKT
jgi:uncharacterized protein (TIGR00251 family)